MSYIRPDDVNSPKDRWNLIEVLDEGGEGTSSLALGMWDGKHRLGMRWNGSNDKPVGNPQSRGLATWFLLEEKYHDAILQSGLLAEDKLWLAQRLLSGPGSKGK